MGISCMQMFCADASLARLNYESLTQQAQMEIVVNEVSNKEIFQDEHDNFKDLCYWNGVFCNETGEIIQIDWCYEVHPSGKLNLNFLPLTVQRIYIFNTPDVSIDIDFQRLPPALVRVSLENCTPQELDLHSMSANMEMFIASHSQLTGTLGTDKLPKIFDVFNVEDNELHGTVDFTALPPPLTVLSLKNNHFTGTVNLEFLPKQMEDMVISGNMFEGTLNMSKLPHAFQALDVSHNNFSGEIALGGNLNCLRLFEAKSNHFTKLNSWEAMQSDCVTLSNNNITGNVEFEKLPRSLFHLSLQKNKFSGSILFQDMPLELDRINLSMNRFDGTICLSYVPDTTTSVKVSMNQLSGETSLKNLVEKNLIILFLCHNKFEGSVNLTELPHFLRHLSLEKNNYSGTLTLSYLPESLRWLMLGDNNFSGIFDIGTLQDSLEQLDFSGNAFENII